MKSKAVGSLQLAVLLPKNKMTFKCSGFLLTANCELPTGNCNFNKSSFIISLHPFTFAIYFITTMKKFTFIAILALFCSSNIFAQHQYEILVERPNEKTYKGIISRDVLTSDTSFTKWYVPNQKAYTPNATAQALLSKNKDSVQLLVFMGTWCEDSQFIIPKLFALTDAAGFSNDHITLIGVDRQKKTLGHLSDALNITNVPTIIVLKKGKELGRVIEYGKSGSFDKDLAEILQGL